MDNIIPTDQFDQQVLDLVNQERTDRGLDPLTLSERLDQAADDYSQTMIDADHFSHTGPNGSSMRQRIEDAGYTNWNRLAENIAAGQRTPEQVVQGWMNSSGHRANILNPDLTHMGLGYAEGNAEYGNRWTQVFGAGANPGQYQAAGAPALDPAPAPMPAPVPDPMPMPAPDPIPTPNPVPTPMPPTPMPDPDGGSAGSGPLDLSDIQSYGGPGQDRNSRMRVSKNSTGLKIRGNGWKRLGIDYNITPDTMMKVEFRSRAQGEIQGIGFDSDNRIRRADKERMFQFSGTQDWGNDDFKDYVTGDGWKTYEIPVGDYFTGDVDYLTFANDHDVRRPTAMSDFRNIELFEKSGSMSDTMDASNDLMPSDNNSLAPDKGFCFPVDSQGM